MLWHTWTTVLFCQDGAPKIGIILVELTVIFRQHTFDELVTHIWVFAAEDDWNWRHLESAKHFNVVQLEGRRDDEQDTYLNKASNRSSNLGY